MKRLNKFFYALLAVATVGMVSCSEDVPFEPGPQEVSGCHDVYFPTAEELKTQGPTGDFSQDPTASTVFTYTAYRGNLDGGAITVPVKVTTNTNDMFTMSELSFAEGSDVATFTVTLAETAEVGVPYTFAIAIEDPLYVKQYQSTKSPALSFTVTRVKWIDLGECDYSDDLLTGWYSSVFDYATFGQFKVKVQVRADSINEDAFNEALAGTGSDAGLAGVYRLVNPYNNPLFQNIGGVTFADASIEIVVLDQNHVYIPLQPLGVLINGAPCLIYSEAAWAMDGGTAADDIPLEAWGYVKGGKIGFPIDMVLGNPGGTASPTSLYYANRNGLWSLTLAPKLGKYSLVMPDPEEMTDGDFAFEEVALDDMAAFYSESQVDSWTTTLEKGVPSVTTDDADRDFVTEYGFLYRLSDLYTDDYPIYFSAKDNGTVTLHGDFAEQDTGLEQNGYEVYMAINPAASTFDAKTYELTLSAELYSYQGEYMVSYGTYREVLSVKKPDFPVSPAYDIKDDFVYTDVFTDTFTSSIEDDEWDATLQIGDGPSVGEFKGRTAYRIPSAYAPGYDIYFLVNDEDGSVSVPTGYEYQAAGISIYGADVYINIIKGTMAKNGVSLTVGVYNNQHVPLMPHAKTETLYTYLWNQVATGTYTNQFYGDADGNLVPLPGRILENADGTDLYRIRDFWDNEGYHMIFSWDKKTNKCEVVGVADTGYYYAAASSNVAVVDARTYYLMNGYDYSWSLLEQNDFIQPSYDPATKTFSFELKYILPDYGGAFNGWWVDTFVLDGEVTEAKWNAIDTGSFYSGLLTDKDGNDFVAKGVVVENKEGTNEYRLVDFLNVGGDYYLTFKWNKETNEIDLVGYNDTGLPAAMFGVNSAGNAMICDILTFYNKFVGNTSITWDMIVVQYGSAARPVYDPATKTIKFVNCYVFPDANVLFADSFFPETFKFDGSALTEAATPMSVNAKGGLKFNAEAKFDTTRKNRNLGSVQKFTITAPEQAQSFRDVTPKMISRLDASLKVTE